MTPDGTITNYFFPNGVALATASFVDHLVLGPDGNIWFAINTIQDVVDVNGLVQGTTTISNLGNITPTGTITLFPLPGNAVGGDGADYLTAGSDGNIWYTRPHDNRIGRMTTSGQVTEFDGFTNLGQISDPANQSDRSPYLRSRLFSGPDGNVWFIEPAVRKYGKVDMSGNVTEFDMPTGSYQDLGEIFTGPDGAVWGVLGSLNGPALVRISSSTGELTIVNANVTDGFGEPVRAADGTIWAINGKGISKLTPDLQVSEYWGLPNAFQDGPNLLLNDCAGLCS
jgi:virginiamycin B lyase